MPDHSFHCSATRGMIARPLRGRFAGGVTALAALFLLLAAPDVQAQIDGRWMRSDGTGVEISGSSGVFYVFGGGWAEVANRGYISLGDAKFRNISKLSATQWAFDDLYHNLFTYDLAGWSDPGTGRLTLSADGNTLTTSSRKDGELSSSTYTRVAASSLNGRWKRADGTGVQIDGATGIFYAFGSGSPGWQQVANAGLVRLGDAKFRYISQVSARQWNCSDLWYQHFGGVPSEVRWSASGTITMSADGGSITTQSPSPFSGESGSSTYYRETGWDAGFVSLGGSWKWLWWFGYYIDLGGGWIWHQQHKFMYTASTSASSLWFYDDSLDAWFWTSSSSYPYLFALQWSFDGVQTSAWCWYQVGSSNPRWYLRLSNGQWYRD